MNESITKAAQSVALVVADLKAALLTMRARNWTTEAECLANRAAAAYLAECLADALKLQSRLEMIAD